MTSPCARSLAWLRAQGWTCQAVEHWNAFAHVRQDLWNVVDIVAMKPGHHGSLGVQATTTSNASARIKKSVAEPKLLTWLQCGNGFEIFGWSKTGKAGTRKRWTLARWSASVVGTTIVLDRVATEA